MKSSTGQLRNLQQPMDEKVRISQKIQPLLEVDSLEHSPQRLQPNKYRPQQHPYSVRVPSVSILGS